ncbi:hypothetical protein FHS57_003432 [Runella defluvii]|uniref:DUF5060 domain-containing protein n=1 Tax=Runella defluvii TaxID=370973 RepID=A0A7W5ZP54_9BACT|nr:hypothetical protein [Runella defluvii]MBB3839426.1 hypothetical protein [Runella defluvii]
MMKRCFGILLLLLGLFRNANAQGIPKEVLYEPDEGGYPQGYTPNAKLGTFDLSSTAANEPFRHLLKLFEAQKVVWDDVTDFRDYGFKAFFGGVGEGKPKENRYADINEGIFRDAFTVQGVSFGKNPVYVPDPNRLLSAQGKNFRCFNAPFLSITIENVDEAGKWNPFLLTEYELDRRAKYAGDGRMGFLRWDIETFSNSEWSSILRGRQVWENGKYRHAFNGGTDPTYKNWDDQQFFDHVQHRWSYVFTELFYKTKLYSNGAKIWQYGAGPINQMDPFIFPQFDDNGNIHSNWGVPNNPIWKLKNKFNNRAVNEELNYMEAWDFVQQFAMWAVLQYDSNVNYWVNTDIIRLKETPKTNVTAGVPTRYHIVDIGADPNTPLGNRRVRVSLHAQDGSLRNADKTYRITFQHWRGFAEIDIPAGSNSVELTTTSPELVWQTDDHFLLLIWSTIYCARYQEPTKLGFLNWEPTPRTYNFSPYSLATTDIFEQRIYDAMIGFANLQNYGVVNWEANTVGKINPMVRESIILAQKKIAPYKTHIENQSLVHVDVSIDGGQTWITGGYPQTPFEAHYNGWWMGGFYQNNQPYPMVFGSYNAQQRTFLFTHLAGRLPTGTLGYKVRVKIPSTATSYTFDMSSTRDLGYSLFKI